MRRSPVQFEALEPTIVAGDLEQLAALVEADSGQLSGEAINNFVAPWVREGEQGAASVVRLEPTESLPPTRPKHPGTIAVWAQLEGEMVLRGGSSRQRKTNHFRTKPGETVAIVGNGKRSFENDGHVTSRGLLLEVTDAGYSSPSRVLQNLSSSPLSSEIDMQDVNAALLEWQRQDPGATARIRSLYTEVDEGVKTPDELYSLAQQRIEQLAPNSKA